MAKFDTPWDKREHSSYIVTRYFSGGWEFETAKEAREYVDDQHAKTSERDRYMTAFRSTVKSCGVETRFWHGSLDAEVSTKTYKKGATMRECEYVPSPSDCTWLVPGTSKDY